MNNKLVLNPNSNMEVKIMKNKKKKGFTLIELIAVIAILGILAAILVPNITGYMDKAKISTAVADAKIVCNAFDAYNSDATTPILENIDISTNTFIVGPTVAVKKWPIELGTTIVSNLRIVTDKSKCDGIVAAATVPGTGRWNILKTTGIVEVTP